MAPERFNPGKDHHPRAHRENVRSILVVIVTQEGHTGTSVARDTDAQLPTKGRTNSLKMAIETVLALHSPKMHKC